MLWRTIEKGNLNCLFEILRVFRILKRIPANQHHVEGHTA